MTKEFLEAVKTGDIAKVREMITANPSLINSKDQAGISSIVLAKYYGRRDVAEFLLSGGPELNIFEAATVGATEKVGEHLKRDPTITNSYSPDGFTPLHLAVFFGNLDIARLLVESGANVNAEAKNPMHVRPLHSAVAGHGDLRQIVQLLLEHGADVNARQEKGFTSLHGAAQRGDADAAQLLLGYGAEVNAKLDDGRTPLAMTREEGREAGSKEDREKTAKLLRNHGAI